MKRSSILAHRGMHKNKYEKNTKNALTKAMDEGFGIETDLRDLNGKVVISHDRPIEDEHQISLEWLFGMISRSPSKSRIALNIKADGLSALIESSIATNNVDLSQLFVFDMAVPDACSYIRKRIPVYSRISDYEPSAAFIEKATGIWLDNMEGTFQQIEKARELIELGYTVSVVSPELHGRDHSKIWKEIVNSSIYKSHLFEICTDLPIEAASIFCEEKI